MLKSLKYLSIPSEVLGPIYVVNRDSNLKYILCLLYVVFIVAHEIARVVPIV